MAEVIYKPDYTIEHCKQELAKGFIGILECHLHKDNSWFGVPFKSRNDKEVQIRKLKQDGYEPDLVVYYEVVIYKLENPHLTVTQRLQYLIDYMQNLL